MNNWLELDSISSRGSQADKAGSLGALHEKRKETLSQFFTPEWVVKFAWNSLSPSFKNGSNYALFDNSIGTASMFRFADPSKFSISGYDIDANIIGAVSEFLESSGFQTDIKHASLENAIPNKYSASIINPPFSITLNSPYLTPYPGITHYGKFGPNSSALSHEYALAQALDCSSIVVAVVPSSTTSKLKYLACTYRRLRAIYSLPSETFMSENVSNVSTDLLIFGGELTEKESLISENLRIVTKTINKNSTPDNLFKIKAIEKSFNTLKGISVIGVDESSPVVTMPVSNDKRVILNRSGRNISLKFFCGATEGKVKNALYRDRLYSSHQHRYPKATKYSGQHQLNIDTIILQDNPFEALNSVTDTIKRAGGLPVVTRDLLGGIKALINKHKIMSTPFGRTAYRKGAPVISATAKKTALLNRKQRGAVVSIGDQVTAQRTQSGFLLTTPNGLFDCDHDLFFSVFEMSEQVSNSGYWEQIHPPLKDTFPKQIKSLESKALSLNLDKFLSWDFQMEDLLEVAIRPYGCIVGWQWR